MRLIQTLKDRITNFEHQINELETEKDCYLEKVNKLDEKIADYHEDIGDMRIAIEKLEKPE